MIRSIFGLPNEVGLSELLKGTATTDSGDVIHESMVKNLFILTSGGDSDDSTILVHENQLRELINDSGAVLILQWACRVSNVVQVTCGTEDEWR